MVDSDKPTPVETLKKPVKQVPVKKEAIDEMTLADLSSAASMVWMCYKCRIIKGATSRGFRRYLV